MFMVFAWKAGEALGGLNDFLDVFDTEDQALALTERLLHTDPRWETHIANNELSILFENATCFSYSSMPKRRTRN